MKKDQKTDFLSARVRYIPINDIRPNPQQPRRRFDSESLQELAASIAAYGILQPITVRQQGAVYELVAGERRWRAARIAGLRQVPCLLARVDEEDAALLALIENLQRRDLDYMEEAAAIARLLRRYGLSQQQAAERLGRSQSAVANKLRLLRLEEPVAEALHRYGLTERHAPCPPASGGPGAASCRRRTHRQKPAERRRCRRLHRPSGRAKPDDAAPPPQRVYHQGRPAVSQQRGPGRQAHADRRRRRQSLPPGYGGHHLYHRHHPPRKAAERGVVTLL